MLCLPPIQRERSSLAIWPRPGQSRWATASALTAMVRVSIRPWAFSSVPAWARSGGGPSKQRLGSEGGKVAERFGDTSFQRGLVVFDGEQVMAVAAADVTADFALGENRVARDDAALQRQPLQQHHRRRDLVLVGFDRQIADHGAEFGRKGGQHVHGFAVEAAAAFKCFAVDGDVLSAALIKSEQAQRPA